VHDLAAKRPAVHLASHALRVKADLPAAVAAGRAADLGLVAAAVVRAVAADFGRSVVAGFDLAAGHAAGSDLAVAIALAVDSAAVAACSRLADGRAAAGLATAAVVAASAAAAQLVVGDVAGFAADLGLAVDRVVAVPVLVYCRVEVAADFHGLVDLVDGSVAHPWAVVERYSGPVGQASFGPCSAPVGRMQRCQ
jgi:hypothetical protein